MSGLVLKILASECSWLLVVKPGKNEIQIALSQLKPGMFVVKLDVSWLNSPFLRHKRLISDSSEIQKLKKAGVKHVLIDISKGLIPDDDEIASKKTDTETSKSRLTALDSTTTEEQQQVTTTLDQERNAALKIRALVMYLAHDIYAAMEGDKEIDKKRVAELTALTLQSLKRNEHALMNLVHFQQKSRKLTSHAFAVFGLALNFGLHLKLTPSELEKLAMAALLHEAGWIKLPMNLMGKRTAYTETELELIHQHPTVGVSLLATSRLQHDVETIILQHHEHCDGSGYPNKLQSAKIHKLAKVLAICDSYDELIHQLRDTPGVLPATAVKQLYQAGEKGVLDKELVHAFISMTGIYPVTSAVELNTGEKAVVREVRPGALKTPSIAIWYNKRGFVMAKPEIVDLARQNPKDPQREIERILDPEDPSEDPANCLKPSLE